MVLYIINHILKRLVFKIIYKEKYSNYENDTQHNKIINVLIGLGSFAIITFVLFYPIGTMFKIIIDSARVVDFKFTEEGKILFNNPIIRVYANNGSEYLFNQITETKDEENNKVINTTTEFKSVITMSIAAVGIENATNVNENTNEIKNAFNEAYIAPTFISELCSNAANRWKNNKPFMGQTIELPNDSSREIYIDLLDIVSKWEREDLLNNIDTIFDFYDILMRYDIIKQDNQTDLVNALTDEKFDEELFLCLLHNKDLRFVIASFMNYGLKESLATLDIDIDVDYVETAKIMKMTDEEIKKEAQIFSVAVRQIVKIGKAINDNSPFTKEEYQEIMSNLSKIKDSKLLNDSLYKAMNKLLKIYNQ